jgi:hypothetical protein
MFFGAMRRFFPEAPRSLVFADSYSPPSADVIRVVSVESRNATLGSHPGSTPADYVRPTSPRVYYSCYINTILKYRSRGPFSRGHVGHSCCAPPKIRRTHPGVTPRKPIRYHW